MNIYDFFKYVMYKTNILKAMQGVRDLNKQNIRLLKDAEKIEKDSDYIDILMRIEEKASRHERELVACINETLSLQRYAMELINRLDRAEDKAVMIERYLLAQTWEEVAEKTHWSISQIYIIHRRAMDEIIAKASDFEERVNYSKL